MPQATAIDIHAHYLGTDLPAPSDLGPAAPRLVVDSGSAGRIMCGDATFRTVTSVLWDVDERLHQMDLAGLSHQVLSPVPVTMEHAWAGGTSPGYARAMNTSLAAACDRSGGRLYGLGCLPAGDPGLSVEELRRCLDLGLRGVEIGTRIGADDLDSERLGPFWEACERLGAAVFVHPVFGGRGVVRRAGQPFDLGLGMLTDTAIAASSLVFGGVLRRHPGLRIALAHGCGTFPWAYPRLAVAAALAPAAGDEDSAELTRRLFADTLVFDDEHLRLLVHRLGPDRLLLGSDAPFFPDQMRKSMAAIDSARLTGALPADTDHASLARNALDFLGLSAAS